MAQNDMEVKAVPDDGTLNSEPFESLASKKVQLDIDDAPFLMDEEEAAPPPAEPDDNVPATAEAGEPVSKRKKWPFLLAGLVLLLAAAAAWYFFMGRGSNGPSANDPPVIVVPSTPASPPPLPTELITRLEPFWLPVTDQEGRDRFLVATFVLGTENGMVNQEIDDRLVTIRDAIYYYLRNKEYEFLLNVDNAETVRADLLASINNYLVHGELEHLYFDSYLLQ